MEIESAGLGAGSGILGVIFSWLVFRDKVNKIEKTLDDKVVYKDTCAVCDNGNKAHFDGIDRKLDKVDEKLDRLLERR